MNESFVLVHDALDRALIREGELQSLQIRLEERKGHIRQLNVLEGNQAVEISKLKEDVKRLEGELRSREQGMEALMVERADHVDQVMSWEAEEITARIPLKRLSFQKAKILPTWLKRPWSNSRARTSLLLSSRRIMILDSTLGWRLSFIISRCTIGIWIILSWGAS